MPRSRRRSGARSNKASAKPAAKKVIQPTPSFDVLGLRKQLGRTMGVAVAPRNVLAKLMGVHENSVSNWEKGSAPNAKRLAKLRQIASASARGKLDLPKPRGAARRAAKPAGRPSRPQHAAGPNGAVDVGSLRSSLGLSRAAFAKLVGASDGSIFNWEHGTTVPSARYVTKLGALAARAKAGEVVAEAPRRPGRPVSIAARATIVGTAPVLYANQLSVTRGTGGARLRFGLLVPGERGARAVADIVLPEELLGRLAR